MKRNTDLLNPRIVEMAKEVEADFKLNQMNLTEQSMCCSSLKTKWIMIYHEETKMAKKLDEAEKKAREDYVTKFGQPNVPKFKTEKEAETQELIIKIKKAKDDQTELVRFLDDILRNIVGGFGFDIKNSLDAVKLEN